MRELLTSSTENIHVLEWAHAGQEAGTRWSIRKFVLHGGRQEGVDLIVVDNGRLQITLIPTRGMGIREVTCGDVRLGFDSPVKEVVHPQLINLPSRGGIGWLEGFGEWLCRCGLESAGAPGPDTLITNTGAESTMQLTLHGKIANIPASEVEVIVEQGGPGRIRVRGQVNEITFFGPKLELWTEVSTAIGSREFQISDTVTNRGAAAQEFQLLYHANFGRPLLQEGARLLVPARRVEPINEHAAADVKEYASYRGPIEGYVEQVYCFHPKADEHGKTTVMLRNAAGDRGVSMRWSLQELPYFTQWKNTLSEADGYVTGLEPATGFPYNRSLERIAGRVPRLDGGQSRSFTIDFAVLGEQTAVGKVQHAIESIQGDTPCAVETEPEVPGGG